ncbi:MAG: Kae1-associated serine/threonine protein kinase [Methanomassiliicoccales archaeon]|nr:Kae1-associated serine/threonine protein kinase [Methanomassiliicoccales archaeon]
MEVIRRGAEAEIRIGTWMGRRVIVKSRVPKTYRHQELDRSLRSSRTKNEARLIQEARNHGVPTPIIYDVDLDEAEIVMEEIRGERVKDVLGRTDPASVEKICDEIGRLTAVLHSNGIVHGDLTTSNMILRDGRIWLIDFSLGGRKATIEEMGVDLHLVKQAFLSAHSEIFDSFQIVLDSYKRNFEGAEGVIDRVREIEGRGRYT